MGNAGDDLLLQKTIRIIRDKDPKAKLCVLYPPLKNLKKLPPFASSTLLNEITYVNRWAPLKVFRAIYKSHQVILGGGSLLQDQTSSLSLYYYTVLIVIARLFQKNIVAIGQGIDPFKTKFNQFLAKQCVKACAHISVRDPKSLEWLNQIPLKKPATLATDLGYYKQLTKKISQKAKAPVIGLCLSPLTPLHILAPLVTVLLERPEDYIWITAHDYQDYKIRNAFPELNTKIIEQWSLKHWHFKSKNYRVSAVVTMRYHTAIWASINNAPFLMLAKAAKHHSLATTFQQPVIDLMSSPTESTFRDALAHLLDNRPLLLDHLQKETAVQYRIAKHSFQYE